MAYEPIELTEANIRQFAASAVELCRSLDEREQRLWHEIISRAGGDGGDGRIVPSQPTAERHDQPGQGVATARDDHQALCDGYTAMLTGIWEAGTIIAPRYSGAMPNEGGGTLG